MTGLGGPLAPLCSVCKIRGQPLHPSHRASVSLARGGPCPFGITGAAPGLGASLSSDFKPFRFELNEAGELAVREQPAIARGASVRRGP